MARLPHLMALHRTSGSRLGTTLPAHRPPFSLHTAPYRSETTNSWEILCGSTGQPPQSGGAFPMSLLCQHEGRWLTVDVGWVSFEGSCFSLPYGFLVRIHTHSYASIRLLYTVPYGSIRIHTPPYTSIRIHTDVN